jgi:hypothetical protein
MEGFGQPLSDLCHQRVLKFIRITIFSLDKPAPVDYIQNRLIILIISKFQKSGGFHERNHDPFIRREDRFILCPLMLSFGCGDLSSKTAGSVERSQSKSTFCDRLDSEPHRPYPAGFFLFTLERPFRNLQSPLGDRQDALHR